MDASDKLALALELNSKLRSNIKKERGHININLRLSDSGGKYLIDQLITYPSILKTKQHTISGAVSTVKCLILFDGFIFFSLKPRILRASPPTKKSHKNFITYSRYYLNYVVYAGHESNLNIEYLSVL
jgi:hypothetical protein